MVHGNEDMGTTLEGLGLGHVSSPDGIHRVGHDRAVLGVVRSPGRVVEPLQSPLPQDSPQPAPAHLDALGQQTLPDFEAALAPERGVDDFPVGERGNPLVAVRRLRSLPARRGSCAGRLVAMTVSGALSDVPDTADGFDAVGLYCEGRCGPAHFRDLRR